MFLFLPSSDGGSFGSMTSIGYPWLHAHGVAASSIFLVSICFSDFFFVSLPPSPCGPGTPIHPVLSLLGRHHVTK
eukprot:scaffold752_cov322-Pavlova_lutheri.AAC.50